MHWTKIKEEIKSHWQVLFGLLCIVLAVIFFAKSGNEIKDVSKAIKSARLEWIYVGVALSIIYVSIQGLLYLFSFKTIHTSPGYLSMVILYLKRLLLGVLLPAGGLASLAFTTPEVERKFSKPQIYFASAIYLFASCTSILLFSIPAILLTEFEGRNQAINPLYLIPIVLLIAGIAGLVFSYVKEGWAYRYLTRHFPKLQDAIEEVNLKNLSLKFLLVTFSVSVLLDFTGVLFAFAAMQSIAGKASLGIAFITYAIVFIIGMISPFMNGLGAIEAALTFLFKEEGYSPGQALLTALIYRFFSFWIPLIYSAFSYVVKRDSLILKVFPAFFSMLLGFINIITILFPSILTHKEFLQELISDQLVAVTRFVQFALGIILILNSVYLFKRYRQAWLIVVVTCILSTVAHLIIKDGLIYAIISLLILAVLIYTRKDYQAKDEFDLGQGLVYFLLSVGCLFLYGAFGFYFIGEEHFMTEITFRIAVLSSLKAIVFSVNYPFSITTGLGEYFILSVKTGSVLCFLYLVILLVRPLIIKPVHSH